MNTFWSSSGWKQERESFSGEDFEYAKSKGLMFDPITITHNEIINRLHELHQQKGAKERVAAAFLHSLSTKKVHLRSALSSCEDLVILHNMLEAVQNCDAQSSARQLEKRWKDVFPSSKNERDVIMEVWGYAGLLVPQDTPRKRLFLLSIGR